MSVQPVASRDGAGRRATPGATSRPFAVAATTVAPDTESASDRAPRVEAARSRSTRPPSVGASPSSSTTGPESGTPGAGLTSAAQREAMEDRS